MKETWYSEGLCFECTRCGDCCGGEPGVVIVSEREVAALARRLGMDRSSFSRRYVRRLPNGAHSLKEKANYDCVFYRRGEGCTVYADRPRQCRTWPFWGKIVKSRSHWEATARKCPGMNRGRRHSQAEVELRALDDGTLGA